MQVSAAHAVTALGTDEEAARRGSGMNALLLDLRYAVRVLAKSRGFTAIAVLTLALGIGANTAIFTFIDALYLKPLPVAHAQQLMHVYAAVPGRSYNEGFSGPEFELLREHASSFSALAAETQIAQLHVVTGDGATEVRGAFVSANYFDLLGAQPRLGRGFVAGEDAVNGRDAVAVISNQLWRTQLSSDSAALGAEIHVNGVPVKIVGI